MRTSSYLIIFFIVTYISIGNVCGQEIDYTQYYLNLSGFNPGFTGMEDYMDIKIGIRDGSNNFDVKNNDFFFSANGSLGGARQALLKRKSLRVSDPDAFESKSNLELKRRLGIGGMVTNRTVGPYTSASINGNYAYHLPISKTFSASLGMRMSYGSQRVDFTGYTVRNPVNDLFYQQLLLSNSGIQNYASVDFGSVVYSKKFYIAVSSTNLALKNLSGIHQIGLTNKKQLSLQAAGIISIGNNFTLNTGLKLTQVDGYPLMMALNSRFRYKDFIYVGVGYSNASKMSFLFGCTVKNFTFNYAYDNYYTGVNSLSINVNELVLGIIFNTKFESKPKFW